MFALALAVALAISLTLVLGRGAAAPEARALAFMVDDPATGQFLMAGGEVPSTTRDPEQSTQLSDVWTWTGHSWERLSTPLPADATLNGQENGWMAYDPLTRRVMLVTNAATLTWDGRSWLVAKGTTPNLPSFVAFDRQTNQLLALASDDDQQTFTTWVWTLNGWQRQKAAATLPGFPYPVGNVAYDGATHQLLYIGWLRSRGDPPRFTMESWTGRTWVQLHPQTSPSDSLDMDGFAYDGATGQVVLYEDTFPGFVNQTWTWNGSSWTEAHHAVSPPSREMSSVAYDSATKQLLLFGGSGVHGAYSDTWNWTGTNWVKVA